MSLNSVTLLPSNTSSISCSFPFVSQAWCRCLVVAGVTFVPYETQRDMNRSRMVDMDAETTLDTRPTSNVTIQSNAVAAYLAKLCNSAALETQIQRLLNYYYLKLSLT